MLHEGHGEPVLQARVILEYLPPFRRAAIPCCLRCPIAFFPAIRHTEIALFRLCVRTLGTCIFMSVSVQDHLEYLESFVIPCRQSQLGEAARCGRLKIASGMTAANTAIPATGRVRNMPAEPKIRTRRLQSTVLRSLHLGRTQRLVPFIADHQWTACPARRVPCVSSRTVAVTISHCRA